MSSDFVLYGEVCFRCANCKATCKAGFLENNEPAVVHPEPTCELFDEVDITEFVVQARIAKENELRKNMN